MAVPIVMPKLGMVMSEGMLTRWTRPAGEAIERGEVVAEIETEKVNYDLEATASGLLHPVAEPGATVEVEGLLGYLLEPGEPVPEPASEPPPRPTPGQAPATVPGPRSAPRREERSPAAGAPVPSTPGARKAAASLGVDISQVPATGPRGRVTEADVRAFADAPALAPGMPEPAESGPLTGARRAIAANLRASLAETAQLSFFLDVDVTDAQRLRREHSTRVQGSITLADVMMKACAQALRRVPAMNAMLTGDVLHRFDTVNIGLAVALDGALVVPVVRGVENMSIYEIAAEAGALAEKARAGGLLPDDLAGGTFTLSVLGMVDGFTPILNAGQTGILGVGRTVRRPVVRKEAIVAREMATLSLTVDHQVVDGWTAGTFLRRVQQALERPAALFEG